jgi:hypothetical protein
MALLCNPEGRVRVFNMQILLLREILFRIMDKWLCPVMSMADITNILAVKV